MRWWTAWVLLGLTLTAHADRERRNIDFDWRFKAGDVAGQEQVDLNDSTWRRLDVPHDWSIEGEYAKDNPTGGRCGYLPAGVVWYRKELDLPADWKDKKISVQFDSVFMDSTVWLNGVKLGNRPYGYVTFEYDLTAQLKPGRNVLAVRADNTKQPSGRWYTGTGILGHVHLLATEETHVKHGGVFFQTLGVDQQVATIQVQTEIDGAADVEVTTQLLTKRGCPVTSLFCGKEKVLVENTDTTTDGKLSQRLLVKNPKLWGVDEPNLYTLRTIVKADGHVVDTVDTQVGIRTLTFDKQTGFYLNDQPLKMQGVCEHHDGGPVGGAFPEKILRERIQLLKDMGCNAIRTAHNPRTKEFYDICNELGMMVMDEIFDGWHLKAEADYGGRFFDKWWKTDVEEWLRANRNNPCIVMYSIGNETGEEDVNDITGYIKKFDTSRPTTGGTVFEGVDIKGYNGPGGKPGSMQKFHQEFPDEICVRTEVPHTLQTRGFYRVRTWWRDKGRERNDIPDYGTEQIFFDGHPRYSSCYDNCGVRISARTSWRETRDMPWIIGEFRWTGFDYIGEAAFGGGEWPARIWNFGVIDLAGLPKDHYWFYQSQWSKEPMVHLLPHWSHRFLKPGTIVPVVGYSNCDEVELFLNGQSLGRKSEDAEWLEFVWQVPYAAGELKAVGYNHGKKAAEKIWMTSGPPVALKLETNNAALKADRRDTATLTFQAQDAAGNNVPWTMNRVEFKMEGPVKNLGFENGDPLDVTTHRVNHRNLFYGYARGFLQATDNEAPIQITAASILGDTLFEQSQQVAIDVQRVMLRGKLPKADYIIGYQINGEKAKRYTGPFMLQDSATVKAVVFRDDKPLLTLSQQFVKGEKPMVTDVRWSDDYNERMWDRTFPEHYTGPFDPQIIGEWSDGNQTLTFAAEGHGTRGEKPFYWCYDWPNDAFEAGVDDAGVGQINWRPTGATTDIEIDTQEGKTLFLIDRSGKRSEYKRIK